MRTACRRISASTPRRLDRGVAYVHLRATNCRCQRSNVVGRDDRGDLAQHLTAHPEGPHGESPPLGIGETQAPSTELPAQEVVLFDQVGDRFPFAALQPADQDQQQHLEGRGIDHERELISITAGRIRP
jgi:hypothetical protein